jgi:hypothetical protein
MTRFSSIGMSSSAEITGSPSGLYFNAEHLKPGMTLLAPDVGERVAIVRLCKERDNRRRNWWWVKQVGADDDCAVLTCFDCVFSPTKLDLKGADGVPVKGFPLGISEVCCGDGLT